MRNQTVFTPTNMLRFAPLALGLAATSLWPTSVLAEGVGHAVASAAPRASGRQKTCGELPSTASTAERNQRCVAMAGPVAAYRDGTLILRMDDGKRKVFKNDASKDDDAFGYALLDYYPALHLFVVADAGIDDGKVTAVDGRTGTTTEYGSTFPYFSPTGRWIMVESSNASSGDPSTFSLLLADGSKRREVWSSKGDPTTLSSRQFRFLRWDDDTHARFELGRGRSPVLLVRAQDGRWHYDLADEEDTDEPRVTGNEPPGQPKP